MTIYGNKMMTELTGQTSQPGTQTSLKAGKEEGRHISPPLSCNVLVISTNELIKTEKQTILVNNNNGS